MPPKTIEKKPFTDNNFCRKEKNRKEKNWKENSSSVRR